MHDQIWREPNWDPHQRERHINMNDMALHILVYTSAILNNNNNNNNGCSADERDMHLAASPAFVFNFSF